MRGLGYEIKLLIEAKTCNALHMMEQPQNGLIERTMKSMLTKKVSETWRLWWIRHAPYSNTHGCGSLTFHSTKVKSSYLQPVEVY